MGWFDDAMRLRDVIQVLTSIEIPLPAQADGTSGTTTSTIPRTGAVR